MKRQIILWAISLVVVGAILYGLGRFSKATTTVESVPAYSLSPGATGMIGSGVIYGYDFVTGKEVSTEYIVSAIQRYLENQDNPDLTLARLREFRWAYLAQVVERSTGRHAFGMMVSKATAQISPEVGPNLFWNTKYGSMIAEVGGGYGMVGRLLPGDSPEVISLDESQARKIAAQTLKEMETGLKLSDTSAIYYGFYEFYVLESDDLVGEVDVNAFNGQVWYKSWGEAQLSVQEFITAP